MKNDEIAGQSDKQRLVFSGKKPSQSPNQRFAKEKTSKNAYNVVILPVSDRKINI